MRDETEYLASSDAESAQPKECWSKPTISILDVSSTANDPVGNETDGIRLGTEDS